MKHYSIFLFILLFTIAFQISCKKNPVEHQPPQPVYEYFPNTVGSWWKYARYDSTENILDTVTIYITKNVQLPNGLTGKVWKTDYSSDTNDYGQSICFRNGDTISEYGYFDDIIDSTIEDYIVILPIEIGQRWKTPVFDSSVVVEQDSINVLAGEFYCFQIYRRYYLDIEENYDRKWFCPKVGFIKLYLNPPNFAPNVESHFSYELLSYHIEPVK
ncbi:MAG: hypothetical protein FJ218_04790 [Ignavibacteria bacterium]|nr:hypothetical protein [Ignavibacteria bacterium]